MTNLKDQPPTISPPPFFSSGLQTIPDSSTQAQFKIPFWSVGLFITTFPAFFLLGCTRTESKRSRRKGTFCKHGGGEGGSPFCKGGVHLDASNRAVCEEGASPEVVEDKSQLASHCFPLALEKLQPWERERFKQNSDADIRMMKSGYLSSYLFARTSIRTVERKHITNP